MFIKKFLIVHKEQKLFDFDLSSNYNSNIEKKLFTSVLIGENGCGKSYFLSVLADFFNEFTKRSRNFRYNEYHLIYIIDKIEYEIKVKENDTIFIKNGITVNKDQLEYPKRILSISYTVEDKFSFYNNKNNSSMYLYGGVRSSSNSTFINSSIKILIKQVASNIFNKRFQTQLVQILEFIGYAPKMIIEYEIDNKGNDIEKFLKKRIETTYSNDYRRDKIKKILGLMSEEELIKKCKGIINNSHNSIEYEVDIFNPEKLLNNNIFNNLEFLDIMVLLKILKSPNIKLLKNDYVSYSEASSGEKQILTTFVKIAANIKKNSLVLIDEPELSLHPKWQNQYIEKIKTIFSDSKSSHIIIATHSHFLVSDLYRGTSSLSHMKIVDHKRVILPIEYSTFGWSAENILYDVFEMRTSRNMYFLEEVTDLLNSIEKENKNYILISEKREKLSKYILNEKDPLNKVLAEVDEYLNDR